MSKRRTSSGLVLLLILLAFSGVALAGPSPAEAPQPFAEPTVSHPRPFDTPRAGLAGVPQIALSPVTTGTSIADLVAQVDGDRWHADVTTLAQFGAVAPAQWGTRRTLTAGNLAARDWLAATLSSLGWTTSVQPFFMMEGASYNVIAERVGSRRPDEIYIVGAHMDSISPEWWTLAPGAEDNASGTAGLLEIARILQGRTPASTIRLIAFSAEEQGLLGSEAYASYLEETSHELDQVQGVYIMDMIGYTSNPDSHHVVLESRDPGTYTWMGDFRDHLASMAATYTDLQVYTSNHACCSDHMPFLWRQVPAVLLIGAEAASYPYYHTVEDLPEYVVPAQGAEVIRAVVAALASKAGVVCVFADVTCDGVVDLTDLVDVATHWRLDPGEAGNGDYDLNHDARIDIVDVQIVAMSFSQ